MLKHYSILGITSEATLDCIKKSYKKLALRYHPDHNGGDSTEFLKIQESYQYLLENYRCSKNHPSYSNIFRDMFKTMKKEPIKNHSIQIDVSLKEAFRGFKKTLKFKFDIVCSNCSFVTRDRCKHCGGVGYIKEEKTETFLFNNITHQNQTHIYKNYYKGINLLIKIVVVPSNTFYLKKDIIYSDIPLNIFKAILGGNLKIETPAKNEVIIVIPEGNIKDFSCCLKGDGLNSKNFIINFKVYLPKNLTSQQKKLLNNIVYEK